MQIFVADREAWIKIHEVSSIKEWLETIALYEADDKIEWTYTDRFYDIVNEDWCTMLDTIDDLDIDIDEVLNEWLGERTYYDW